MTNVKPAHVGDLCRHCQRHCRVPVTHFMPEKVVRSYELAGLTSMATCEAGAVDEQSRLGVSYGDVIVDRVERARAPR